MGRNSSLARILEESWDEEEGWDEEGLTPGGGGFFDGAEGILKEEHWGF